MIAARDQAVIAAQLGRAPRGLLGVAHRCPCGLPDVAETAPRLPDGSPFPTLYYLTCPRAAAGTQSAGGMPGRVKCLHALVAHELAAGGVNPFGREALDAVGAWWLPGPCVDEHCVPGDGR